jgi:hypothetical protein
MPAVQYIRVRPVSEIFSPVVRAFGNLAVIGPADDRAAGVTAVNTPTTVTSGGEARDRFPGTLGESIALAFRQAPGPSLVIGIRVDTTRPDWRTALGLAATLDVQFVVLAGVAADGDAIRRDGAIDLLAGHVADVSTTGEDGRERIGVAMLRRDATDPGFVRGSLASDRMVYVAHKSDQDAAAAVAGTIAGYPPHVSPLLKPVAITSGQFSAAEIITINGSEDFSSPPVGRGVIWLTDPALIPGGGTYLGEAYTGNAGEGKKFIDIVRTLDDVSFRLKARLIKTVGFLRISRSGLRSLIAQLEAVLDPLVRDEVIEGYELTIPILAILDREVVARTPSERRQLDDAQADRLVTVTASVDYAGAIHRLSLSLNFH